MSLPEESKKCSVCLAVVIEVVEDVAVVVFGVVVTINVAMRTLSGGGD
jgi:hypothetical protein